MNKIIRTGVLAIGFLLISRSAHASWVWHDTGWGRNGSKSTESGTFSPGATASYATQDGGLSCSGTLTSYARAGGYISVPIAHSSATANVSFATTRRFYWNGCTSCPNPPTSKSATSTASADWDLRVNTYGPIVGRQASGTADAGFSATLDENDDWDSVNGTDVTYKQGTTNWQGLVARSISTHITQDSDPNYSSDSKSATLSVNGHLKCAISFYTHYYGLVQAIASATNGGTTARADGAISGTVPQ